MDTILVAKGAKVFKGDQVGTVGTKGNSSGPHLHIEVRINYSGTSAIGGASCGGSCTYAQIASMTENPVSLVTNTVTGHASVSNLTVPSSVVLGQNFNITVILKEVKGAAITFDTVALKILKSDGTEAFDFKNFGSVTVPANGTWTQTATGQLFASSWPPGTYKAVLRGNINGKGFDFATTGSGVNPVSFTATSTSTVSEVDTLLNSEHETSWAYFQNTNLSNWFISNASGVTYGLGRNSRNHAAWIAIGNGKEVASVDFSSKKVSVASNTFTSSTEYKAVSLVDSSAEWMYSSVAKDWARLIEGTTVPAQWYFFRVNSTREWYIIEVQNTGSRILRLNLTQDKSDYDWKNTLDGAGNPIDTSTWKKNFYQEASTGKWMVSFTK